MFKNALQHYVEKQAQLDGFKSSTCYWLQALSLCHAFDSKRSSGLYDSLSLEEVHMMFKSGSSHIEVALFGGRYVSVLM